jgi:hypothetical protein
MRLILSRQSRPIWRRSSRVMILGLSPGMGGNSEHHTPNAAGGKEKGVKTSS